MEKTDFSFIQTQLDVIERNLNDLEGASVDTTVPTEVIDNVLQSFSALNESNLDKMDLDTLEIVNSRVSNIHERIEGLFDKHVMTGDMEDRIRSQMDQLTSHLPQKEVWTELISDSRFSKVFQKAAQKELGEGVDENMISKLPFEVLMLIFSYIPDDRRALGLTSKAMNYIIRRGDMTDVHSAYRLEDLEKAMNEMGSFPGKWIAMMDVVTSRLEESGIEATARNVYEELIKFQAERFPPKPFETRDDPFTVEGFLAREKVIHDYNKLLYIQKAEQKEYELEQVGGNLKVPSKNWREMPIMLNQENALFGEPLTEIPIDLQEPTDSYLQIRYNEIFYISPNCFKPENFRELLDFAHNDITRIEKDTLSNVPANYLYFNDNKIHTIHKDAFSHKPLSDRIMLLDFSNNNITTLDPEIFDNLPHLGTVYLKGNPLDDKTKKMLTELRKKFKELSDHKSVEFDE
ncbi:MAG: hypothetical protein K940chlam3_01582 [Chlamydiae bacterium]|nr:hypothetical protein [Chlamydiota bacterium]